MVQTDIDVCNLAISRVSGGAAIEALTEESPMAEHCLASYPHLRGLLLGKHRWVFASRIAQLARQAVTPQGCPLSYAFTNPGDVIGAIHAFRESARIDASRINVIPMDGYIAADAATVWAEYTWNVPEARWPMWFVELVRVAHLP